MLYIYMLFICVINNLYIFKKLRCYQRNQRPIELPNFAHTIKMILEETHLCQK